MWLLVGATLGLAGVSVLVGTNWHVLREAEAAAVIPATAPLDVAIVPGCHVHGLTPAPTLRARLEAALALYQAHQVRRILVTGNDQAGETAAMRHWLLAAGVPERDIVVDGAGTRTISSMRHAAAELGVHSAAICTQKLFMARSLFLARDAGLEAVGVEARFDPSARLRSRALEAVKRTVAFGEVELFDRTPAAPTTLAANVHLE